MTPKENSAERKARLFVALKPPAEWREHLAELQRQLRPRLRGGARWVDPEQIHVTLRFFGWVHRAELDSLRDLLLRVGAESRPFELHCAGAGCFPSPRRPRVLWAGLAGENKAMTQLYDTLKAATARIGEPPEDRPFKPHLTLARFQNAFPITEALEPFQTFAIAAGWLVRDVQLIESHLSPHGARYETLLIVPLSRNS